MGNNNSIEQATVKFIQKFKQEKDAKNFNIKQDPLSKLKSPTTKLIFSKFIYG